MVPGENDLLFSISNESADISIAKVQVSASMVDRMYQYVLCAQKQEARTYGFTQGTAPLTYIEHTHKPHILEHLKEFFFTHCVINFLCKELFQRRFVVIGDPWLIEAVVSPVRGASFLFELHTLNSSVFRNDWKRLPFKCPERKNYKDLDRQVTTFLKEENERLQSHTDESIQLGDWISFELSMLNSDGTPILENYVDTLWLKIGEEEADRDAQALFLNKKVNDCFSTKSPFLQSYMSLIANIDYTFQVKIKERIPAAYFSLDLFKRHFKLKSAKETHLKLIEVFSYRNDLSQRRETVEAIFKTLLHGHSLHTPSHLISRQQKLVLEAVHVNPDYHVYKSQDDFKHKVRLLAEKQLKETLLIDCVSSNEHVQATDFDVLSYLNLSKRARTKEFIYFDIPPTKIRDQEIPLPQELLRLYCLREKTLNYIISALTRK
jgi:FKBP-type peptidyl-prolyl cis-trans isomerase (trigger factor)